MQLLLVTILLCGAFQHSLAPATNAPAGVGQASRVSYEPPADWRQQRESGVDYYKASQYRRAISALIAAFRTNSRDPRTLLYLGLSYESAHEYDKAAIIYRYFATLKLPDSLLGALRARVRDNFRMSWRREIQRKLSKSDAVASGSSNSVAVLYFRNVSGWSELDPVIKGIAELLIHDLAKLKRLKVEDRGKIQVLVEELGMRPTELYDRTKIPEIARLLEANFLITGGIERIDETDVRLSAGVVDGRTGDLIGAGIQVRGRLSELAALEKEVIVQLTKDLGLEPVGAGSKPVPANSLALIAFSKGLDFEDRNQFSAARKHYQEALRLDRNFRLVRHFQEGLPGPRLSESEMEKLVAGL